MWRIVTSQAEHSIAQLPVDDLCRREQGHESDAYNILQSVDCGIFIGIFLNVA